MKSRNRTIRLLLAGSLAIFSVSTTRLGAAEVAQAEGRPPNLVVILADDWGYGDARCYNPEGKIPTPHVDRLAREGMKFTDAHSASGLCTPTRYGILTGRYPWRTHLQEGVLNKGEPLIAENRLTVASLLKSAGYRTAAFGKWHLGWETAPDGDRTRIIGGPLDHGFDSYFGVYMPNRPPYAFVKDRHFDEEPTEPYKPTKAESEKWMKVLPKGPKAPSWDFEAIVPSIAAPALDWLRDQAGSAEPFFMYYALTSPHFPIAPSSPWQGRSGINRTADFFMETDDAVGQVLAVLDETGLADHTIVVFAADNGHDHWESGMIADFARKGHAVSGPYREAKASGYEGGHRVPFIVRWPGVVPAGSTSDALISLNALMATSAELIGQELPPTAGEDSFSILPLLKGSDARQHEHPFVITQNAAGQLAIRKGPWKYIHPMHEIGEFAPGWRPSKGNELYHLGNDPGEKQNLATLHPEELESLEAALYEAVRRGRTTPGDPQENDLPIDLDSRQIRN